MLNLATVQNTLAAAPAADEPLINTLNPTGLSITYRQFKLLGWVSTGQVHPVNRTSTLTLGPATLYSLHNRGQNRTWMIEIGDPSTSSGCEAYQATGSAAEITAAANELIADLPTATTPAAALAGDLAARHPELAKRIEAGLDLYERDIPLKTYTTTWQPATDQIGCDCPDATYRRPHAFFGAACKHSIKLWLKLELSREHEAAGIRKLLDAQEQRAA